MVIMGSTVGCSPPQSLFFASAFAVVKMHLHPKDTLASCKCLGLTQESQIAEGPGESESLSWCLKFLLTLSPGPILASSLGSQICFQVTIQI